MRDILHAERSFTRMNMHNFSANLAFDTAAPDKLALASCFAALSAGVEPAPAAERLAAVALEGSAVAFAAGRARNAQLRIGLAVGWGLVDEDQLLRPDRDPALGFLTAPQLALGSSLDSNRVAVAGFEELADVRQARHGSPAGFQAAGSAVTVTTALNRHQLGNNLDINFYLD